MDSKKNNSSIPELRFPEFKGDWEEKSFGDLYKKHNVKNDLSFGVDKIISVANMYYKEDASISNVDYLKTYNIFRLGDIAYEGNKSANFAYGRFVENTIGDGIVSHVFDVYSPTSPDHNLGYWKYAINYERIMRPILEKSTIKSTMMTNLISRDFLKQRIRVPSPAEQQKIADCLSAVDIMISTQEQKIEALKEHKKGLLQQVFPKTDETTPAIRFPGYEGEWEDVSLGEIGDTFSGLSGKSKEDFENGNSKFITFMNVLKNVRIDTQILGTVNVKAGERQNKVLFGDMLFNTSSETPEEVGFCSVYDSKLEEDVYLNSFCFGYRFKDLSKHSPLFLAFYMRSKYGRELMHKLAQGITRFNLSKEYFNRAVVRFPSLPEQQKIASFLSIMEDTIFAEEEKLEALMTLKKGLMQRLFPVSK